MIIQTCQRKISSGPSACPSLTRRASDSFLLINPAPSRVSGFALNSH
jgi:hypothetical protein